MSVKIPGAAVQSVTPDHDDISKPTTQLLRDLSLLPEPGDLAKAGGATALFTGPPDSVAVIEAGATAASKWWATGIAVSGTAVVARITTVWDSIGEDGSWNQPFALVAIAIVLAAMAGGISYLLGSDVRGRAAAMVATIEARRAVATAMLGEAGKASGPQEEPHRGGDASAAPSQQLALGARYVVSNIGMDAANEDDWLAIASREKNGVIEYLLVKGTESEWTPSAKVKF